MAKVGAHCKANGSCKFTVWAPEKEEITLKITFPEYQTVRMQKDEEGYFSIELDNIPPGTKYFYAVDGTDSPDPASFYQPEGVHGPSEVTDLLNYQWHDEQWRGLPLKEHIIYELHVGTFSAEGTFDAIIPRLDELQATGINAIELMPVSQFPGNRNWGYDSVYPFAVQHSYGGPAALQKLVDACHQKGIAVILDVVYNHLGPEGNYLSRFGPYYTDQYRTPWGAAINFDGAWSDGVKEYFSDNVIHWLELYHIDGLRLDAIHAIFDNNAITFWDITHQKVEQLEERTGRKFQLIAESDYNSPRVIKHPENGGLGLDAQWLDDFHHALYVMLDKNGKKRYEDYGTMEQLAKAYTDGFVHSGEFVKFRKRRHGASSAGVPGDKFIVFVMNHDQVGNRIRAEKLCRLVDGERLKLAAAALLLSPYIPMLFMGEEYADESPFFYFTSHSDENLIRAVQEGRRKEFAAFLTGDEEFPDPQAEKTFLQSKLQWDKRHTGRHNILLQWYRELIALRRSHPILRNFDKSNIRAYPLDERGLILHRQSEDGKNHLLCLFNFSDEKLYYEMPVYNPHWKKVLDSKERKWRPDAPPSGDEHPPGKASGEMLELQPLSITVYLGDTSAG